MYGYSMLRLTKSNSSILKKAEEKLQSGELTIESILNEDELVTEYKSITYNHIMSL